VFIPSRALSTQDILHVTKSDKNGTYQLPENTLDIGSLPLDVPLIVWFHGGGMTIGNAHDNEIIALVSKLTELSSTNTHVAVCSIEFSLAPEHPFPAAVSEALTAVDYILSRSPDNRRIHLAGISAGANLAANCVSQFMTRYSSCCHIQSVLLLVPMLNPASDSTSCYLNSRQIVPASTQWIRWSWQQYLQLPPSEDVGSNDSATTLHALLGHGSNRTTWNKSVWKNTPTEALVDPTVAMAYGLLRFDPPDSPDFIISTNEADSLHDAGISLYEALRAAGANVQLFDFPGSHWTGTRLDKASFQKLVQAWKQVVFGSD
jgi:acetyl esterase/lipase